MPELRHNTWLEREDDGDLTVLRFRTKRLSIDDDTRDAFDQIYAVVDDMDRTKIILNLGQVEFISSLALGKLVMLNRKIQAKTGRLALCQLTSHVDDVIRVTHLTKVFKIFNNEQEARAAEMK